MTSLLHDYRTGLILTALFGSLLIFPRLSGQCLWQDEAQTALISKTILTSGVPKGTDGINYFSQEDGAEYGKNAVWQWHPWLSFYTVALSFYLFGQTTWAARLPFALFGLGTLLLTYRFVWKRWKSMPLALFTILLLGLNINFLLITRQCRFYALGALLSLWATDAYLDLLERDHRFAPYVLVASLVLLLHTFHFFYATLVVALLTYTFIYSRQNAVRIGGWISLSVALNLPWLVWFHSFSFFSRSSPSSTLLLSWHRLGPRALGFASGLLVHGFTLPLSLIGAFLLIRNRVWKTFQPIRLMDAQANALILSAVYIAVHLFCAMLVAPDYLMRYLVVLWAPCAILAAQVVLKTVRWNAFCGIAVLLATIASRPVGLYGYELLRGAHGTVDNLVDFFEKNGKAGEIVLINYDDMPLKFYTPMHVLGGLTGEDLTPARKADWIVPLQHLYIPSERGLRVPEFIKREVDRRDYDLIQTSFSDSMLQNREEVGTHLFRTPTTPPYLVIFHRRRGR